MLRRQFSLAAFTLIEMLLVIVVISVILIYGVNSTLSHSKQDKIDKTAAQILDIQNAATAYYVLQGKWPAKLEDLKGNYLDASVLCSPWITGGSNTDCGTFAAYDIKDDKTRFAVSIALDNPGIAKNIGSRLASAAYDKNVLTSYIAVPAFMSNRGNQLIIKNIYQEEINHGPQSFGFTGGVYVKKPICPPSWQSGIAASIMKFIVRFPGDSSYDIQFTGVCQYDEGSSWRIMSRTGRATTSNNNVFSGWVLLITYCYAPGYKHYTGFLNPGNDSCDYSHYRNKWNDNTSPP